MNIVNFNKTPHAFFTFVFLCSLMSQAVLAETVYVRDTLYVPLRGGQTIEHRILHRGLKSGTKLELIETIEDTGFSKVKMENDVIGWIKTQYLTDKPLAADLLIELQREHAELSSLHQQTLLRLQTLDADRDDLSQSQDKLTSETVRLRQELDEITALSENVISINEENERLGSQRDSLNDEIANLMDVNRALHDGETRNWFLLGAGVVFGGLLIGFWIARQLYNKRGNSGWR
jgi:SH3 domain protein